MASPKPEYETRQVYPIPDNFTEGTGLFGGIVQLRNFLEGCVMALPVFILMLKITAPIKSLNIRMTVIGVFTVFPFLLGCIGINGDPVTKFLSYFFVFRKKRRVMRYNPRVKLEFTGEIPQAREVPIDKIRKMLRNLGQEENSMDSESDRYFAIDRSIAFDDDLALERRLKANLSQRRNHNGKEQGAAGRRR